MLIRLSYSVEVRIWAEKLISCKRMKLVPKTSALAATSAARRRGWKWSFRVGGQEEETKAVPCLCFSPHAVPKSARLFWQAMLLWWKGRRQYKKTKTNQKTPNKTTTYCKINGLISYIFAPPLGVSDVSVSCCNLSLSDSIEGRRLSPLLSFLVFRKLPKA